MSLEEENNLDRRFAQLEEVKRRLEFAYAKIGTPGYDEKTPPHARKFDTSALSQPEKLVKLHDEILPITRRIREHSVVNVGNTLFKIEEERLAIQAKWQKKRENYNQVVSRLPALEQAAKLGDIRAEDIEGLRVYKAKLEEELGIKTVEEKSISTQPEEQATEAKQLEGKNYYPPLWVEKTSTEEEGSVSAIKGGRFGIAIPLSVSLPNQEKIELFPGSLQRKILRALVLSSEENLALSAHLKNFLYGEALELGEIKPEVVNHRLSNNLNILNNKLLEKGCEIISREVDLGEGLKKEIGYFIRVIEQETKEEQLPTETQAITQPAVVILEKAEELAAKLPNGEEIDVGAAPIQAKMLAGLLQGSEAQPISRNELDVLVFGDELYDPAVNPKNIRLRFNSTLNKVKEKIAIKGCRVEELEIEVEESRPETGYYIAVNIPPSTEQATERAEVEEDIIHVPVLLPQPTDLTGGFKVVERLYQVPQEALLTAQQRGVLRYMADSLSRSGILIYDLMQKVLRFTDSDELDSLLSMAYLKLEGQSKKPLIREQWTEEEKKLWEDVQNLFEIIKIETRKEDFKGIDFIASIKKKIKAAEKDWEARRRSSYGG